MRPTLLTTLLLLAAASGCGREATAPVPPGTSPTAVLVATHPTARSAAVAYDTEIWGQFDRPLDPATVGTLSVFLKLDGQRIPSTVSYDSTTYRVRVRPTPTLELRRTYTVEFTPSVRDAGGTPLAEGIFFQFTTNSLRRVSYDFPGPNALEGPVVTLGWGGAQIPLNELFYEVYASTDSLAVATRSVPPLQRSVFTRYVPHAAWPAGGRVYWAVTSENLTTAERMEGPVQVFRVLPEGGTQEMTLNARDFGSNDIRSRPTQYCNRITMPSGPSYNAAIHWAYNMLPADACVVSATLTLTALDVHAGAVGVAGSGVWISQHDWLSCSIIAPGPPYPELSGLLASGTATGPLQLQFTSARLAAFIEAMARQRTFLNGMLVRTPNDLQWHSPLGAAGKTPLLVVRYRRLSQGPPS